MNKNWFIDFWSSLFGSKPSKPTSTIPNVSVPANNQSVTPVTVQPVIEPTKPIGERKMRKRALLVGINLYGGGSQLNGCVNDVMLVNQLIRQYWKGIENSDIRMLTDASATTANILDRLRWLVDGAKAGDCLLYHFSGHGVQMACPNYEIHKEADGLDECICPVDFDWRNNVIRDEDYKKIFANVPAGVNLTIISDSCHSGDLLREMVNPMIQPSASPNKIRTMPIPPDIKNRAYGLNLQPKSKEIRNINNEQIGILISGCKDTQTSADAWIQKVDKYHGALTYFLSEVLKDSSYDMTYAELIIEINQRLSEAGYEQEPQLDCADGLQNKKFLQSLI